MLVLYYYLINVFFAASANCAWYSDGNLHNATIKQWKQASSSNQLATAADWTLKFPKIKRKVLKSGSMETLKPYAVNLVNCLNEASTEPGYDNMSSAEMATLCGISLGWTK